MGKFRIRGTYKHLAEIYEVETQSKEEALDMCVNEHAGNKERIDVSYEPESEDNIEVIT